MIGMLCQLFRIPDVGRPVVKGRSAAWSLPLIVAALLWSPAAEAAPRVSRFKPSGQTVYDKQTRLTWQRAVPRERFNWTKAKAYCTGLHLAGKAKGWRLPTDHELMTLIDKSAGGPMIDRAAFPETPADAFWSSSHYMGGDTDDAWVVSFGDGQTSHINADHIRYVRCVR
jgi:hypothetical protein